MVIRIGSKISTGCSGRFNLLRTCLTVFALLAVLLSGCAAGPIQPDGTGCAAYGVPEENPRPLGCPVGPDGLPVVNLLKTKDMKHRCGNKGFFDKWTNGCIENGQAYVWDAPGKARVIKHEQCHCILGPGHVRP